MNVVIAQKSNCQFDNYLMRVSFAGEWATNVSNLAGF